MISLRLFSLLLITLACREVGGEQPHGVFLKASLAVFGAALGFGLLFKASAMALLSTPGESGNAVGWHRFSRVRQRIEAIWILILPAALLATDWGQWLNSLQRAGLPQAIALLGWFLPSALLLVLLEMTAAQIDELCEEDLSPTERNCWRAHWIIRLRLGEFSSMITCLAPVLLIALATDIAGRFTREELSSQAVVWISLLSLSAAILFLPVWLGRWMGATRLPAGKLKDRIAEAMFMLDIRGVEPMLLRSRGRWAGAAVVGWIPKFRRLWLGDALIDRLSEHELEMVVMHELAHIRRRHFLWRALPVIGAFGVVCMGSAAWPVEAQLETVRNIVAAVVASVVLLFGLGVTARLCELDADRTACELAEKASEWARRSPGQAARELGSALSALLADNPGAAKSTWLHPSLKQRLENLNCPG